MHIYAYTYLNIYLYIYLKAVDDQYSAKYEKFLVKFSLGSKSIEIAELLDDEVFMYV
jgi:hypothetical protein